MSIYDESEMPAPPVVSPARLGRRLGAGRQAEVFAWDAGKVVKLYRQKGLWAEVRREMRNASLARELGFPAPRPYEIVDLDGRPGLILERIEGEPLTDVLFRRPWRIPELARAAAEIHAQMHSLDGGALPAQHTTWETYLRESLQLSLEEQRAMLMRLHQLPTGTSLCHGDLTPDNVLVTRDGLRVIDWCRPYRGNPVADVAKVLYQIHPRLGTLDHPWRTARLWFPQPLVALGCRWYSSCYLRHYRRLRPLALEELRAWTPVAAAVQLELDETLPDFAHDRFRRIFREEMASDQGAAVAARLPLDPSPK